MPKIPCHIAILNNNVNKTILNMFSYIIIVYVSNLIFFSTTYHLDLIKSKVENPFIKMIINI